ncbi:MAG: hypothetical protein H7301_04530 [Cryobacterium sp.]|nr:hypothetical protein [Oligoflexia bacterium]
MSESASLNEERSIPEWLRRIQLDWALSIDQLCAILRVDPPLLEAWIVPNETNRAFSGTIPPGLDSAVPLISIYRRLTQMHPETEDQVKWLFTAHTDFGGAKPIDVAASSLENLYWVGYFLDSAQLKK